MNVVPSWEPPGNIPISRSQRSKMGLSRWPRRFSNRKLSVRATGAAWLIGGVLIASFWASAAWSQPFSLFPSQFELSGSVHLDEVDSTVRAHLERVKAYIADGQWDEAV